MGFSRQEYWSGSPFPSPGDLPDPGIKPGSLASKADALTSEPPGKPLHSGNSKGFMTFVSGTKSSDQIHSSLCHTKTLGLNILLFLLWSAHHIFWQEPLFKKDFCNNSNPENRFPVGPFLQWQNNFDWLVPDVINFSNLHIIHSYLAMN